MTWQLFVSERVMLLENTVDGKLVADGRTVFLRAVRFRGSVAVSSPHCVSV